MTINGRRPPGCLPPFPTGPGQWPSNPTDRIRNGAWVAELGGDVLLEIVSIAFDVLVRSPAPSGYASFSAGAQIVTTAHRRHLRFSRHRPWIDITYAITRLEALPNPG
ncbi:hypothetical protein OG803_25495 [Streptomyces sp. NBC_00467]